MVDVIWIASKQFHRSHILYRLPEYSELHTPSNVVNRHKYPIQKNSEVYHFPNLT